MKKLVVVGLLCWLGLAGTGWAQEAVLNNPPATVGILKTVVDTLSPQADMLYNFWDPNDDGGEWLRGLSVGLYTFKSETIPIGTLRVGYIGEDRNFSDARGWYTGANLDLPGLTKRFVPQTIRGIATTGYLDALWKAAGRYGRIGVNGGYDADRRTPILAVSFGLSVSW